MTALLATQGAVGIMTEAMSDLYERHVGDAEDESAAVAEAMEEWSAQNWLKHKELLRK